MACNCGLNEIFTDRVSRHDARKFQRRGLDKRARKLLGAITGRIGLAHRTTLEIGIGTGGLSIEMLKHGAATATGVDAIPNQLQQARRLAESAGVSERLHLLEGDATELGDRLGHSDVVVLDRVVCCYPNWTALLGAAAGAARDAIALTYPRAAWYTRLWIRTSNAFMRLLRRTFRLHLHPPHAMHHFLQTHGFATQVVGYRGVWEILLAQRTTST